MASIVEVAGARPNFMKVASLHEAIRARGGQTPIFVHTGQHYDWEMSEAFFRDLPLPIPDHQLDVGSVSHAEQTARVMLGLEPILMSIDPDVVVVVGDVNSTLGAALTAAKSGLPVAHVEAGLRSGDRAMPEETNRIVADHLSDLLFAPSNDAVENLRHEGIAEERIHMVGNVMIDSLDRLLPRARESQILADLGIRESEYTLATVHRPSNVDEQDQLARVLSILGEASEVLPVILPAHPRTQKRLDAMGVDTRGSLRVIPPLGYLDFLRLMEGAAIVLTDSGGIQEETTVLGVPCLTLRENTERPITVTHGTNQVVGLDRDRILSEVEKAASGHRPEAVRPPLWDGNTAERIVTVIQDFLS